MVSCHHIVHKLERTHAVEASDQFVCILVETIHHGLIELLTGLVVIEKSAGMCQCQLLMLVSQERCIHVEQLHEHLNRIQHFAQGWWPFAWLHRSVAGISFQGGAIRSASWHPQRPFIPYQRCQETHAEPCCRVVGQVQHMVPTEEQLSLPPHGPA